MCCGRSDELARVHGGGVEQAGEDREHALGGLVDVAHELGRGLALTQGDLRHLRVPEHDLQRVLQVVGGDLQELGLDRGGLLRDLLLALRVLALALRLRPRLFRETLLLGQRPRALLDQALQLAPARVRGRARASRSPARPPASARAKTIA